MASAILAFILRASLVFAFLTHMTGSIASTASMPVFDVYEVSETTGSIITIPLDKQYVPVMRDNRPVAYKTAYFGTIHVGLPVQQSFTVVFDTGSGHFLLPSVACVSKTCQQHRRYNRGLSPSAVDIDHDGTVVDRAAVERDQVAIAFGTGEVTGEFVYETVCLNKKLESDGFAGGDDCVTVRVVLASEMTEDPFHVFEFDGVLGLGLESLALDPEFSFFGQMSRRGRISQAHFGVFVSKSDLVASEISFGGHDPRRMSTELSWAPVTNPDAGYWQVSVTRIRVGDEYLPLCEEGGCVGILDTGTSLLGVPRHAAQNLHWLLARKVPGEPSEIDCRHWPGPDLVFELEGVELVLGPEDYSRPAAMRVNNSRTNASHVICRSSLLPVDMGNVDSKAFIFGEPVLRRYYTTYDWAKQRIGFAEAHQPEAGVGPKHHVFGAPPDELPVPAVVRV